MNQPAVPWFQSFSSFSLISWHYKRKYLCAGLSGVLLINIFLTWFVCKYWQILLSLNIQSKPIVMHAKQKFARRMHFLWQTLKHNPFQTQLLCWMCTKTMKRVNELLIIKHINNQMLRHWHWYRESNNWRPTKICELS